MYTLMKMMKMMNTTRKDRLLSLWLSVTNAEYDAVANVGSSKHKKLGSGVKLYQCIYIYKY